MKILRKTISLITVMLLIFSPTYVTQINTYATSNLGTSYNRSVVNVGVLFSSFDDPFMQKIKQNLEDIQKENENNVRFNFFDGKNNIAVQSETLDTILKNHTDLIIAFLSNLNENTVEGFLSRVKQQNVPIILVGVAPEIVSKVSKYYDKAAFVLPSSKEAGIIQGKILANLWNADRKAIDKNNDNILQYILLQGNVNNPIAIERTKYVTSTINESEIKTEQLASINTDWNRDLARISMENLILKYNGRIEAIIANNDNIAIGAIEALQKYGYNKDDNSKHIPIVGIDGIQEAIDSVDKGIMTGTVIEDNKEFAKTLYTIGLNLVNNLNPTENTNYTVTNGEIIIPFNYQEYIKNK